MALIRCPTCRREFNWDPASEWRPFCSERCKLIDLGAWASERHVISSEHETDASNDDLIGDVDSELDSE